MRSRFVKLLVAHVSLIGTVLVFQNCGPSFHVAELASEAFDTSAQGVAVSFSDTREYITDASVSIQFTTSVATGDSLQSATCQLDNGQPQDCRSGSVTYADLADGNYSLRVIATTTRGGRSEQVHVFRKDSTAPVISVSSSPSAITANQTAAFTFVVSDNLSGATTTECSLNNAVFAACTSPATVSNLTSGPHGFRIRSTDRAGNVSTPYSYSWTVNLVVPTVTISAAPSAFINTTATSFSFSGTGIVSYQCQLNNGPFANCTSPHNVTGLAANSAHAFRVRGTNNAGVVSADAETRWAVDTVVPATPVLSANVGAITQTRTASISFSSNDVLAGLARFECSVNAGAYATCTSPRAFSNLADGEHSLSVRAVDNAGNTSLVGTFAWRVDATVPMLTLTQTPAASTTATTASFTFNASDSGSGLASVQCSLDVAAFANCTSPVNLTGVSVAAHLFRVRATDSAGNQTTVMHNWTVTQAPVATPTPTPVPTPTPAPGNVVARMTPTRTSGPAPLAVLFDATDSSGGSGIDAFRELTYSFDFGDNRGETWTASGQNKNTQVGGPIASHIFNVPGQYTVRLRATNAAGSMQETTVSITVQDPNTVYAGQNTVCVSTSGNYAGCPAGALQQTSYPTSWTGRRVLLRRGESFPSISLQDGNSGVQVGAFGAGTARPRVTQVGIGDGRPRTAQFANDITVMDLEVATSISQQVGHRVLIYRNTVIGTNDNAGIAFGGPGYWGTSDPNRNVPANQFYNSYEIFLVENTVLGANSSALYYGSFGSGSRMALMGNVIGVQQQHSLRIWSAHKSVIAHNEIRGISADGIRHSLKLQSGGLNPYSDTRIDGNWASRYIVVANNVFGSTQDTNAWTVAICPENGESAQGIEDVIFENNRFHRGPRTATDFVYAVRRLTYRNNTLVTGGAATYGFGHRAALPADWVGPFYGP